MSRDEKIICGLHKDTELWYSWQDKCPLCKALKDLDEAQDDFSDETVAHSRTLDLLTELQDEFSDSRAEVANLLYDMSTLRDKIKALNNQITKLEDELAKV